MLNLLFISSLPKASALKDILQPQLKAKIDLAEDFDLGLKSVFEKRPAVVIIQEQIAGVSGESVVRHIQMLLGDDAPRFVLLTEGGGDQRLNGLFPFLIREDAPETVLAEQILEALRQMFGDQWPGMVVQQGKGISPEERAVADTMVSDLLSEIDEPRPEQTSESGNASFGGSPQATIRSTADEMASLLIKANQEAAREAALSSSPPVPVMEQERVTPDVSPEPSVMTAQVRQKEGIPSTGSAPPPKSPAKSPAKPPKPSPERQSSPSPDPSSGANPRKLTDPTAVRAADAQPQQTAQKPRSDAPAKPASPAAFRVSADKSPDKEPIPEELLLEFEKNFRSQSRSLRNLVVAVAAVILLGGGFWWLNSGKPATDTAAKPKQAIISPTAEETEKKAAPPETPQPPAIPPTTPAPLPSFAPRQEDSSYGAKRPGWQRYVDGERDVRIFRSGDRIKAVQVVATRGKTLDDAQLTGVLQELTGSSDYALGKAERRKGYRGYLIQQGTAGGGAELVVYRRQSPTGMIAFVVSLK